MTRCFANTESTELLGSENRIPVPCITQNPSPCVSYSEDEVPIYHTLHFYVPFSFDSH
jgi:hypothetical protein